MSSSGYRRINEGLTDQEIADQRVIAVSKIKTPINHLYGNSAYAAAPRPSPSHVTSAGRKVDSPYP